MCNMFLRVGLLFSIFSTPLHATITYDGESGIRNTIFAPHCFKCHSSATADPSLIANGNSARPTSQDWTIFSNVESSIVDIISVINAGTMPATPNGDGTTNSSLTAIVSPDENTLINSWANQTGALVQNAAPTITTMPAEANTDNDSITFNGSITLKASVFANGLPTNFRFDWIEGDGTASFDSAAITQNKSTEHTGGGITSKAVSDVIVVSKCNTMYQYRSRATNSASNGIPSFGATRTVPIGACDIAVDADTDGWTNAVDNCPTISNPDQADLDGDDAGDSCDDDIDGDTIANDAEKAIMNSDGSIKMDETDPSDASLASQDFDGDGRTNLDEYTKCKNLGVAPCDAINNGLIPPVITLQNLEVTSTGYLTAVDLGVTAEGVGSVTLKKRATDPDSPFRPGRHNMSWTATDMLGFNSKMDQQLDLLPLVTLAGAQITGEGRTVKVRVTLNGDAPSYPFTINYTVAGSADASDYDLLDDNFKIVGDRKATIMLNVIDDAIAEADEQIEITLTGVNDNAAVLGDEISHTVVITEENVEPTVSADINQAGTSGPNIYSDQGIVTVTANITDPNGDPITFDWSSSDTALAGTVTADNKKFSFNPLTLAPGDYQVIVVATDGLAQVTHTTTVLVAATPPDLLAATDADMDGTDDATEGRSDMDGDGIPDYLDPVDDPTLLNSSVGNTADGNFSRLMMTKAGLTLAIGSIATSAQTTTAPMKIGARIFAEDIKDDAGDVIADPEFDIVSGVYDFEVRGLSAAQRVAQVVIPLTHAIPPGATFLKLSNDVWSAFVETATDEIRTASSDPTSNECPPIGDISYLPGLIAFNDCIQLTFTDGGPNDADGEANGVIVDPGAVAVPAGTSPSVPSASPNGAGAIDWWWLLSLVPLFWLQRRLSEKGSMND